MINDFVVLDRFTPDSLHSRVERIRVESQRVQQNAIPWGRF
jgi:hypothetical protein